MEHRQALPGRPRRGGCADGAQRVLRAGGAGARADGRGRGQAGGRCGIGWCAAVHRQSTARRPRRGAAGARPDRAGAALRPAGRATGRPRWCSSAASSRTRSPRGRCCPPPGSSRSSTSRAPTPRSRLQPADPDFELWDVGYAALAAAAAHLGIDAAELLYARVDVIGGAERSAAAGTRAGRAVAGLAAARRRRHGSAGSASSRSASSQPWSGSGSVRSRIDAHSAAVAAVQAAAPATCTRHQRGGHTGEELHARRPCPARTPARPARTSRISHRPRCAHGEQPEAQADQQRQVADQQRRVQVHQRGDLDLQPRHRRVDALVAGVRARAGDQRAGHQHRRQRDARSGTVNWRNGFGTRRRRRRRRRARRS